MNQVRIMRSDNMPLLERLINGFAEQHTILNVSISTYYDTSYKEARYVAAIVYEVPK